MKPDSHFDEVIDSLNQGKVSDSLGFFMVVKMKVFT